MIAVVGHVIEFRPFQFRRIRFAQKQILYFEFVARNEREPVQAPGQRQVAVVVDGDETRPEERCSRF